MLSYRKLAMRVLGRPLHTEGIDSPRPASQRAAALVLTAAMLTTLTAPAFAGTWYIEDGDITISAGKTEGTNKVTQGTTTDEEDTNTTITNRDKDTPSSTHRPRYCRGNHSPRCQISFSCFRFSFFPPGWRIFLFQYTMPCAEKQNPAFFIVFLSFTHENQHFTQICLLISPEML